MRKTFATFKTVVRSAGAAPEITISSSAVDRDGDIIEPSGLDATHYLKNPVVLFGHDHYALPIARTQSLTADGHGIRAKFSWLENDPDAARVRNAFDQGVLNAASIGFLPVEWEDLKGSYGRRYTKWQLLEWSIVPVPSNPEAIRTLKSLGLTSLSEADRQLRRIAELQKQIAKSGRVLSARSEQGIRRAVTELEGVLSQLDADDDKHFFAFDDDDEIPDYVVAEALATILPKVLKDEITRAINRITGRVD